jgi:hypothetical protein
LADFIHETLTSRSISTSKGKGKELIKKLREHVDTLHEADFVHGDLRQPNLIVVGEDVWLLDFDWTGKVGEAFYSIDKNESIQWPPGAIPCSKIEKAHDDYWINELRSGSEKRKRDSTDEGDERRETKKKKKK